VFEVSPANGGWSETVLHSFCSGGTKCPDGDEPQAGVTFDKSGNLYLFGAWHSLSTFPRNKRVDRNCPVGIREQQSTWSSHGYGEL
jgi:hypothetical protein